MAQAVIKDEHKQTTIAFGNSGLPLGLRDDIDQLAILAHESQDPSLLNLFKVLPPLAELKKSKVDAELKAISAANKAK